MRVLRQLVRLEYVRDVDCHPREKSLITDVHVGEAKTRVAGGRERLTGSGWQGAGGRERLTGSGWQGAGASFKIIRNETKIFLTCRFSPLNLIYGKDCSKLIELAKNRK